MASFLLDLPSRGTLQAVTSGYIHRAPPAPYICEHDTDPPEHQVVTTDESNILRNNFVKKKKDTKAGKGDKGKRPAQPDSLADPHQSNKRPTSSFGAPASSSAPSAPSRPKYTLRQLQNKTVKDLTDILKARNLNTKGKKEELIQRIMGMP